MRVLNTILGVLLIIMSLVLMIVHPIVGGCGVLFGILVILLSRKKKMPKSDSEQYSFNVAGLSYREENTKGLEPFTDLSVQLIPEPENVYDPNAIKVIVEGKHIGYVPADKCLEVKEILNTRDIKYMDAFGSADDESDIWCDATVFITYRKEPL